MRWFLVGIVLLLGLIVMAECSHKKEKKQKKEKKSQDKGRGKATKITDCTAEINEAMTGWIASFNARNFDKLFQFQHKDFYYITPGVPSLLRKKQFVDFYTSVLPANPRLEIAALLPEVFCMDERAAVGTCIFQWSNRPGLFGRAMIVWIKDSEGKWKLFKEGVDGADLPKSLPELKSHWGRNGELQLYNDSEIEEFDLV